MNGDHSAEIGQYFCVAGSSASGPSNSRGADADDEDIMIDIVDGEG
jgi:hypothetical protein